MVPIETYYEITSQGTGDEGVEEEGRKGVADDNEESNAGIEVKVVSGPDEYEVNEEEGGKGMADDNGESNTGVEVVVAASPDQTDPDPEDEADDNEEQKPNETASGTEMKSTQDDDVVAAASDALDQPDSPTKSKKKRKKKSGKNVSISASSLVDEKSSKDIKTKKKKKKETTEKKEKSEKKLKTEKIEKSEKKEKLEKKLKTEKKEKSGSEKKPKSEKKLKKTKTKKKKKKGDSSKGDAIEETSGLSISTSKVPGDDDGDNDDSAAADDTHTPSGTSVKTKDSDIVEDGVKQHASMMTKLRQAEKARQSQQADVYHKDDSDDEGLWACTDKDSKQNDEDESVASEEKDKMKKMNQKSEWVSSVEADETASFLAYDSSSDGSIEGSLRDDSSRRPSSMSSIFSDASDRSSSIRSSSIRSSSIRSSSARSYRSSRSASARSYRSSESNSRRSRTSGYSFRDLKDDRNSSVIRSMKGEETKDNASVASEGTDKAPLSQVDLRKDLEAQAIERLENSSTSSDTDELIAVLRKSTAEPKSRLSVAAKLPSVYEDGEGGSDNENDDDGKESESSFDDEEDIEKGGKSKGDKKKKKDPRQKWLAFKEKAMSRKGYIVLVSILISLFVIANIVLIVFLA